MAKKKVIEDVVFDEVERVQEGDEQPNEPIVETVEEAVVDAVESAEPIEEQKFVPLSARNKSRQ